MAEITLDKLTKVYGDGTRAVSELDLEIADGEFVVLVGPSGCGKTSALRMVAGLQPITEGRVVIGGEVVNKLPPKDRDIAMIFQNYALYPHMSAFDNMAFALKLRGIEDERPGQRVNGAEIMRDGLLQQVAKPQELYDRPRNLFVAEFIGSPAMNLVGVDLVRSDGRFVAKFGWDTLVVDEQVLARRPGLATFEGKRLILGVRPEDLEDEAFATDISPGRRLSAQVDIREDMGSEVFVHFGLAGKSVRGADVKAAVGEEAAEVAETKGNV